MEPDSPASSAAPNSLPPSPTDSGPVARRTRSQQPSGSDEQRETPRREDREPQWTRDDTGRLERRSFNFAKMSPRKFEQVKGTMSRRDKMTYFVSMCAKRPPRVSRLSRKKLKYKQRMTLRRSEGDRILSAKHFHSDESLTTVDKMINVGQVEDTLTVEHLMNSSLAPFIELAANDCGYEGSVKELICNWVHPLFLKAKSAASKEDNPNWWQAMNGPFADDFWKAAVTEIETLEGMGAWDIVD